MLILWDLVVGMWEESIVVAQINELHKLGMISRSK